MISKKYAGRKSAASGRLKGLFFVCAALTGLFIFIDSRFRPLVKTMAQYNLQSIVSRAANQAVIEQMILAEISYNDLINLQMDENGRVTILSYNSPEVNRLQSIISESVSNKIDRIGPTDIYVPVLNILNIDFLNNKGPRLKFRITPAAYVETDIESSFENTGINQVNHQIFIVLKITSSALIPNYTTYVQTQMKVCVAQTVIIGKVPNNIYDSMRYFE